METTNRAIVFQAHKFLSVRPERAERVRTAENPRAAQAEATRMRKLQRSDWFDVNVDIMEKVLQAKFTQHPELRAKLLATRHQPLETDWIYPSLQSRLEHDQIDFRNRFRLRNCGSSWA